MKIIIILLVLLFSTPVKAENENLWALGFLPVAWSTQTILHEGFHAMVIEALGHNATGFYPYPHVDDGHFYFGRLTIDVEDPSDGVKAAFLLAPYIADIAIFSISDTLLSTKVNIKSFGGTMLYVFGIVAPFVDFSVGYFAGSDLRKVRGISRGTAAIVSLVGITVVIAGLCRVIVHGKRLFRKGREHEQSRIYQQ